MSQGQTTEQGNKPNMKTLSEMAGQWATPVILVWLLLSGRIPNADGTIPDAPKKGCPAGTCCACSKPADPPTVSALPTQPSETEKKIMERLDGLQTAVDALKKK